MSKAESYQALATLLAYPQDRDAMLASIDRVASYLESREIPSPAHPFADLLRQSTLAELQEDYVATFDFTPANAPYLGHHLYGDQQKKPAYLIELKQEFARFGFSPAGCELPDHLSVLLAFLAHLCDSGEEQARRRFLEESVLPGLQKLLAAGADSRSSWRSLFQTAELLISNDCKEVSPC